MSNPYPWMKLYPDKILNDHQLKLCSLKARGLWFLMICIMHNCKPYGHLTVAERAMTTIELSHLVSIKHPTVIRSVAELDLNGIFSRTESGIIFSRKMVEDEELRLRSVASGRRGGNPKIIQQKDIFTLNPPLNAPASPLSS